MDQIGTCEGEPISDPSEIRYARLVFTPTNNTEPTFLVFHNVTTNSSEYMKVDQPWMQDNEMLTDWDQSISLTEAFEIYSSKIPKIHDKVQFSGFVWRAIVYPCIREPSFIFTTPMPMRGLLPSYLFVGARAKRLCKTGTMKEIGPFGKFFCIPECY